MSLLNDLSTAAGALARRQGYAVTIVLTLGLTLGALVTMFNLNYQLLATPLPYPGQDRLYVSQGNAYKGGEVQFENEAPYPGLVDIYDKHRDRFEEFALVSFGGDTLLNRPDAPRLITSYVTPEYLKMMAAPFALGRGFNADEGRNTNSPVAIISHSAWRELFNEDPGVLTQSLRFRDVDFRIVGVTAASFPEPQLAGVGRETQVWMPWDYNLTPDRNRNNWTRIDGNQHLVMRVASTTGYMQIQQELTNLLNSRFQEETASEPALSGVSLDFKLIPFREAILGDSSKIALLLLAGAIALLLIAAANIINLTLARAANQQKTMAIQAALGAQKKHLFQSIFAEILILVGLAALLSLAVALGGIKLLQWLAASHLPRLAELHLNFPSLAFAVLVALALAAVFALLVSRQIDYRALHVTLRSSGKGTGIQVSARVRRALILSQVALTGVLLAASLQILQQSSRHISQPLGFVTADVNVVALNAGAQRNAPPNEQRDNLLAIRDELQNHAKVLHAGVASGSPIHLGGDAQFESYLSGDPDFQNQQQAATTLVDDRFARIFGLTLVGGDNFQPQDAQNGTKSIVVNETFARRWQADGAVLGKLLYWRNSPDRGQTPYRVTGIVRDFSLPARPEAARVFVPQVRPQNPLILLRLKPAQQITSAELNEVIGRVNSQYKVSALYPMSEAHQKLIARDTLSAGVSATLVILAIGLAAIGIYGVLSYTVLIRRLELGVRMAIGARPVTVFMQILKDNLVPVVVGQIVALAALVAIWRWAESTPFALETTATSWLMPVVLIVMLTAATTLLSVWSIIRQPAINALRND